MRLRDADGADLIAHLRSVPVTQKPLPAATLPWCIRWGLARGTDAAIAAHLPRVPALQRTADAAQRLACDEHIVMTSCNERQGIGLRADTPWPDEGAPDLVVVRAYDEAALRRLMREGVALCGRELRTMRPVAHGPWPMAAWPTSPQRKSAMSTRFSTT